MSSVILLSFLPIEQEVVCAKSLAIAFERELFIIGVVLNI